MYRANQGIFSLAAALLVILTAGCSSYGRSTQQVDVTDSTHNRTLNLLQQVNQLEQENVELKNQLEYMQFELDQLSRRAQIQQNELDRLYQQEGLGGYSYRDDNNRLPSNPAQQPGAASDNGQILGDPGTSEVLIEPETFPQQAPPASVESIESDTAATVSNLSVRDLYNSGFEQLKKRQYDESIQTFSTLLANYPNSTFADDAQYWTGEAYYVNRRFDDALRAFDQVVSRYPDSDRAADALLKTGYIYYEKGDANNARRVFSDILIKYPNEPVAEFARERLNNL